MTKSIKAKPKDSVGKKPNNASKIQHQLKLHILNIPKLLNMPNMDHALKS